MERGGQPEESMNGTMEQFGRGEKSVRSALIIKQLIHAIQTGADIEI
jgi:hypothetical protein